MHPAAVLLFAGDLDICDDDLRTPGAEPGSSSTTEEPRTLLPSDAFRRFSARDGWALLGPGLEGFRAMAATAAVDVLAAGCALNLTGPCAWPLGRSRAQSWSISTAVPDGEQPPHADLMLLFSGKMSIVFVGPGANTADSSMVLRQRSSLLNDLWV
eukprot:COSAG05_NODE_3687_length_1907_cov_1.475664_3_plen_155_part_01